MFRAKCVTTKDAAGYDAPIHAVVGNAGQSLTAVPAPKASVPEIGKTYPPTENLLDDN